MRISIRIRAQNEKDYMDTCHKNSPASNKEKKVIPKILAFIETLQFLMKIYFPNWFSCRNGSSISQGILFRMLFGFVEGKSLGNAELNKGEHIPFIGINVFLKYADVE